MGTHDGRTPLATFEGVSNPLGWDGDRRRLVLLGDPENVSNPLGWDGDPSLVTLPL